MKTKLMYDIEDIRLTMRINNMTFTEKAIVESVLQCTLARKVILVADYRDFIEKEILIASEGTEDEQSNTNS